MAESPVLNIDACKHLAETVGLSTEEHGIYFMLLIVASRRTGCALPSRSDDLKRIMMPHLRGIDDRAFDVLVPKILERFFYLAHGSWRHEHLDRERKLPRSRGRAWSK